jgi:hypothetical protein
MRLDFRKGGHQVHLVGRRRATRHQRLVRIVGRADETIEPDAANRDERQRRQRDDSPTPRTRGMVGLIVTPYVQMADARSAWAGARAPRSGAVCNGSIRNTIPAVTAVTPVTSS